MGDLIGTLFSNESNEVKPQEALGHQSMGYKSWSLYTCLLAAKIHNEGTQRNTDFGNVLSILERN